MRQESFPGILTGGHAEAKAIGKITIMASNSFSIRVTSFSRLCHLLITSECQVQLTLPSFLTLNLLCTTRGIPLVVPMLLKIIGAGLAGLAALPHVNGQTTNTSEITSDTFFYGDSPPVYPSRMPSSTMPLAYLSLTQYVIQPKSRVWGIGLQLWPRPGP